MNIQQNYQMLTAWIEKESFCGWDPHDALNSPLLKKLTGKNRKMGQMWVQLIKRCPVNFRPILGIKKDYNPKAMGLFLGSYLHKYQQCHSETGLTQVRFFSDWLQNNVSRDWSGACWGYNFDWPNRNFFAPAGLPTVVNTAFNGLALIEDYQITGNQTSLSLACSTCNFIMHDLNHLNSVKGETCLSYTPLDHRFVHNANVLGAWLLAEVYALTGEVELARMANSCAQFTLNQQLQDGSWPYGVASNDQWVDSFHTGYVLVGLKHTAQLLGIKNAFENIQKGYDYWEKHLFDQDGLPKYYTNALYPIDIHTISQEY